MKLIHIAAVALLAMGGACAVTACGNGDKSEGADSTKNVKGAQQGDAFATNINIRYVDMDSLLSHYNYCLDQEAKVSQIEVELQQYQNQLGRNLQTKQAAIQQKVQTNAYMSEASYNSDMSELQQLNQQSEALMNRRMQADQARVLELKKAYTDAIEAYIVEYNKEHKYDAILFKNAGLYFNPALDITQEVLKGLNDEYTAKRAAEKDAKPEAKAEAKK